VRHLGGGCRLSRIGVVRAVRASSAFFICGHPNL
jgi:hypothetical protein